MLQNLSLFRYQLTIFKISFRTRRQLRPPGRNRTVTTFMHAMGKKRGDNCCQEMPPTCVAAGARSAHFSAIRERTPPSSVSSAMLRCAKRVLYGTSSRKLSLFLTPAENLGDPGPTLLCPTAARTMQLRRKPARPCMPQSRL